MVIYIIVISRCYKHFELFRILTICPLFSLNHIWFVVIV